MAEPSPSSPGQFLELFNELAVERSRLGELHQAVQMASTPKEVDQLKNRLIRCARRVMVLVKHVKLSGVEFPEMSPESRGHMLEMGIDPDDPSGDSHGDGPR